MPTKRPLGGGEALIQGLIWLLATLLLTLFLPIGLEGLPRLENSNLASAEKNQVLAVSPESINPRTPPAPDDPPPGPTSSEPTYPELSQHEPSSDDEPSVDPEVTEPDLSALDPGVLVRAVTIFSSRGGERPPAPGHEADVAPIMELPPAAPLPDAEAFSSVQPPESPVAPPEALVGTNPDALGTPWAGAYAPDEGEDLAQISEALGTSVEAESIAGTLGDESQSYESAELSDDVPDEEVSPEVDYSGMPPPPPRAVARAGPPDGTVFRLSFYCLAGRMSSGKQVYYGAAAADASVFPLGTVVEVAGWGTFVIEDRFGWDAGHNRLDIWVPSCAEAIRYGIKYAPVSVIGP